MTRLDWAGMMRAGVGRLGLTPDVFWSLTPAELALMLGVEPGAAPMTRARLEAMSAAWPDGTAATGKGQGDDRQERV